MFAFFLADRTVLHVPQKGVEANGATDQERDRQRVANGVVLVEAEVSRAEHGDLEQQTDETDCRRVQVDGDELQPWMVADAASNDQIRCNEHRSIEQPEESGHDGCSLHFELLPFVVVSNRMRQ